MNVYGDVFLDSLSQDVYNGVYDGDDVVGPTPINTGAPTLQDDSDGTWSGAVGTWDSQGGGTLTYQWELRLSADDSVAQAGSGASPGGIVPSSADYYLWVRASNDNGFNADEDTASNSVELTNIGSGRASGLAKPLASQLACPLEDFLSG